MHPTRNGKIRTDQRTTVSGLEEKFEKQKQKKEQIARTNHSGMSSNRQDYAKAAVNELISELDRTRKEFAKASLQITQYETLLQDSKDSEQRKDHRIAQLEVEMASRDEKNRQVVALMEEEHRTKDTAWNHRVKHLELELRRLQAESNAAAVMEKENRQLRETVLENQAVMERLQQANDDLRLKFKSENKDQLQSLEEEFKRRLEESEKKFRAEAYRALSEEAKLALQGNDHLQTVLQRQNDSIEAVLLRCKTLENAHSQVQREQETTAADLQNHLAEIGKLRKLLAESKARGDLMDEALKQRKVERASLELLFIEYESTRKQLAQAKEKARRSAREAERWKGRAVQLAHELDDEQREAAEAKMINMQAQSDVIEGHLERKRQRDQQRARVRQQAAEGSAAFRSMQGPDEAQPPSGGDDDGAPWEGVSDEEPVDDPRLSKARASIDPMEILAMWNVNFDTWRPPEDPSQLSASAVDAPAPGPAMSAPLPNLRQQNPGAQPAGTQPVTLSSGGSSVVAREPQSTLNPVRPPPHASSATVSERAERLNKALSVMSQQKNTAFPPGARHYAAGAHGTASSSVGTNSIVGHSAPRMSGQRGMPGGPSSQLSEMSIVSKGEFKTAKKSSAEGQRFLVP